MLPYSMEIVEAYSCVSIFFRYMKNMFCKEVKRVRKGEQARDEMVMDVNVQILRDGVDLRKRWAEYFEQVLNGAGVREANINIFSN